MNRLFCQILVIAVFPFVTKLVRAYLIHVAQR